MPRGALKLPSARKSIIEVLARHSRVNDDLIVPGIPEADTDIEAMEALDAFIEKIKKCLTARRQTKTGELV